MDKQGLNNTFLLNQHWFKIFANITELMSFNVTCIAYNYVFTISQLGKRVNIKTITMGENKYKNAPVM